MKTKPYEIHEAAKIMPPMSDAEYRALKDDIEANGLKNPVALLDGELLDGIHRMQACIDLGMTLRTVDVKLNGQTPAEYVLSQNLHRRHLTTSQRSIIAANLANLSEGRPGKSAVKDGTKTAPNGAVSQEQAAEVLNVSRRNVQRAATVIEEGSKPLQEAVAAGEIPVSTAEKITELPKAEQTAAVKAGKAGIKKAVAKVEKQKGANKPPAEEPKAGDPKDVDKLIEDLIGKLARAIDERFRTVGGREQRDACHSDINELLSDWKSWRKTK